MASSAVAFAVAGRLALASAALATFTPLKDYAVRERDRHASGGVV